MTYEQAMAGGESALADGEHEQARRLFTMAHELGRAQRSQHFAAHRALIRTGLRTRRFDHAASHVVHLAAGVLFDWPHPRTQ